MQNQHNRKKNLHRLVQPDIDTKDILHSHAYGKVADGNSSMPTDRPTSSHKQHVSGYKDSMVGSISQYRKLPEQAKAPEAVDKPAAEDMGKGNRQKGGIQDKNQVDKKSIEQRQHFIEPPTNRGGYNPFG